ncbi:MAG: YebC/PmpR family DNA-binding transcriptional regulator [Planctomycetes bacterium]|nr:YebC/PmpR family DNA-binding transcriptional regulator [Planctomycetota bacterium]
MSGHSKWKKIKRDKASNDARRGQQWSKIAKRIIVAAKAGGGNPDDNLGLRYAIEEARSANMPNETIKNAIKKGTGELGSTHYEEMTYEGYGAGGVAVMCECLTDNRNRTAPELRRIFENAGGQLGSSGCVAWMFHKKGTFTVEADKTDEENLMDVALSAGAEDVLSELDTYDVICDVGQFTAVKQALADAGIQTVSASISQVPVNTIQIADVDHARRVLRLMDNLDNHEDVQNVYANFDIPDELLSKAQGD